jgi:hypothetical protein
MAGGIERWQHGAASLRDGFVHPEGRYGCNESARAAQEQAALYPAK